MTIPQTKHPSGWLLFKLRIICIKRILFAKSFYLFSQNSSQQKTNNCSMCSVEMTFTCCYTVMQDLDAAVNQEKAVLAAQDLVTNKTK